MSQSVETDDNIFSKMKRVKQSSKDLVRGYLNQLQRKHNTTSNNNVPDLIFFTCLSFYCIFNIFELCSKSLIISGENNNIVTKVSGSKWEPAYGSEWMQSNINKIIQWKIKFNARTDNVGVGIVNNNHHFDITKDFYWNAKNSYVYYSGYGNCYVDGNKRNLENEQKIIFNRKDEIVITFDFAKAMISINKNNGAETAVLFRNIKTGIDIKYKFVCCILGNDTSLNFEVI